MFEEKYRWIDPDPDTRGVLLSDRIKFYCEKVHLIEDFKEEFLQPACYTLHVGSKFYLNDKEIYPNENGEIKIPENGLLYFRVKEKINLPYYMIACHDLRVKQVYRGLLVGRGLQVDPGYSGYINYPIFNFTYDEKILKVGDEIGSIHFIKTTPFGDGKVDASIKTEQDLRKVQVNGINNYECKKFREVPDRSIPDYWIGGETHISAVLKLAENLEEFKERIDATVTSYGEKVNKLSLWGFWGVIVLVVALFGSLLGSIYWHTTNVINMKQQISELSSTIKQVNAELKNIRTNKELEEMKLNENRASLQQAVTEKTNAEKTAQEVVTGVKINSAQDQK